ncbi:MAG: hypothetical protein KME30_31330 [Iphinoe sp. HA4291-MV1]|jgi:hypothetical protein|nr:hypothetical protein [Iphinoe sp. HA4291-MV1]
MLDFFEEFLNELVRDLRAEEYWERTPSTTATTHQTTWEVYNYDIIITRQDEWTYHFSIDVRDMPASLKTGTANSEASALYQARDNLKEWFRE